MCGIYGELAVGASDARRTEFARTATAALRHRGPDGAGSWRDDHCLLGHLRLAIIDLSEHASQPMVSRSGSTRLVFNGELYNYLELRGAATVPQGGWRSNSDTEVLVEALDRSGVAAIRDSLGMFAIAAWRHEHRELWLIRDRLGKKPLYYARTRDGAFRFASELGALLADGLVDRSTTLDRLAEFLQLGYLAAPRTGLADVHVVPPGCWLQVMLSDAGIVERLHRYWELPSSAAGRPFPTRGAFVEAFEHTLRDAIRIRLRSDVPLGAFLSGGVDSSVVGLLASQQSARKLRTFTVGFDEDDWSEAPFAADVARRIGSEHTEIRLTSASLATISELVESYGDLHGDSSALATLALCRATRRHVTVALSGDGADELLAGYPRYPSALRTSRSVAHLPRAAVALARCIAKQRPFAWIRGASRIQRITEDPDDYYAQEMRAFLRRSWPDVLRRSAGATWSDPIAAAIRAQAGRPSLFRLMAADMTTYLPDDILVKVDRASMAFGLEVRSPFLDHRLVELVLLADPAWIRDSRAGKLPLRGLFAECLPPDVFTRPKMGFGVPLASWLRQRADVKSRLLDPRAPVASVLEAGPVRRMLRSHQLRMTDESGRIWRLLVLHAWFERWRPTVRS
jgi:asparagine synthase (glutamine-hydrolysing)